ncbi:ABC transporter ATP-binding protein [Bacillus sp. B15-48]|uniref:energy-coupling factor ABC transporter ATP-binding protein n=1 Tax=Bacillus sp. B15-48 TaxID=1548601 RepID=UPI00193FB3A4|nr:ABC transporter ATP-binding protein [Bacillus sp. B15-48]MBM4765262.1 ATP-binding cassette domain-containing protein [Bacillus sp. B15-48]
MINIEQVRFMYPDKTEALRNITCSFSSNKIALLGSNGSGKSTLLQHLNGLLFPNKGRIMIDGEELTKKTANKIRSQVGFVFDNPDNQLFAPTVFEDVAFGPRNLGYVEEEVIKIVDATLTQLEIMHLKEKPPYNLSLGQKKKVAIAGVLAMQPRFILFDEPFSGLDSVALEDFIKLLDKLSESGHTILLSTHDVDIAYSWAQECIILHQGQMVAHGPIDIIEIEEVMRQANLAVPSLFSLFEETEYRPKTMAEAKQFLSSFIFKKEKVY